jgi:hypothetical protein
VFQDKGRRLPADFHRLGLETQEEEETMKKQFRKLTKSEKESVETQYHKMSPQDFDERMSRLKRQSLGAIRLPSKLVENCRRSVVSLEKVLTAPTCRIALTTVRFPRGVSEVSVRYRLMTVTAALVLLPVLAHPSFGQRGARGNEPPRPTPRWPDGTVNWGPPIGEKGLWNVAGGTFADLDPAPGVPPTREQDTFPGKPTLSQVPFQPWARAIYDYRQHNQLEPYTRCKPSGAFRQVATAYGTQCVGQQHDQERETS